MLGNYDEQEQRSSPRHTRACVFVGDGIESAPALENDVGGQELLQPPLDEDRCRVLFDQIHKLMSRSKQIGRALLSIQGAARAEGLNINARYIAWRCLGG
jgi:hypothetical protein